MLKKINVVVVDDSAFMRKYISAMLESDNEIKVIASAKNGAEGYELVKKLKPDLVTMDIEMPVMDGLTALQKIMKDCPVPVLMVSSLTTEGADATIKALEYGAIDVIPKEMSYFHVDIEKIKEELIGKIKEIVRNISLSNKLIKISQLKNIQTKPTVKSGLINSLPKINYSAIAIGVSTGGPLSLQKVLPFLSSGIKIPLFLVQHMPPRFTKSLAERLNGMCELTVKEAENNEKVQNGYVYIAPGGYHMTLKKKLNDLPTISIDEVPSDTLHRPSVDIMMNSVIDLFGKNTLGIIMTGMGKDGFEAIKKLKSIGGYCIAQNEESCVVYGMPRAIAEAGYADVIAPLESISEIINKAVL